ncbi:MAG: PTS sugar transporter subunit IIA [Arsenophonus sp.]|nr:MAG: PTS sugar transporter subunit IIA [Arsenophonus sp.]
MNKNKILLKSILTLSCTKNNVLCKNKKHALEIISNIASKKLNISKRIIFNSLIKRERLGSTNIGNGIAIPHSILCQKKNFNPVGILLNLSEAINYNFVNNDTVFLLFALLIPVDQIKSHLYILSLIAKELTDKYRIYRVRFAKNDEELYKIFTE